MPRTYHLKEHPPRFCQACNALLVRKQFAGGQREDNGRFASRRTCNRKCMAVWMMAQNPNPTRGAYQLRARKFRKARCESCRTTEDLSIHHKNRIWSDNRLENLATLCASCHTTLHHEAGEISKRKTPVPCRFCSRRSRKLALCDAHYSRLRKFGDPCLTHVNIGGSWKLVIDASALSYPETGQNRSTLSGMALSPRVPRSRSRSSGSDSTEQLSMMTMLSPPEPDEP